MKKNLLLLAVVVGITVLQAQDNKKVFSSSTIGWYGLDFTKTKMIGFGDESPHKIKDEYFKAWNEVTIDMDLAKTFQKNSAWKDPLPISKQNVVRETESMKSTEDSDMTPEMIADRIKTISVGSKKDGLGVIFIVQSFNKTAGIATVHVTFFDIATRSVLWLRKMTGKAGGGDTKKTWSVAMRDIFNQIEKKEFKAWKLEANY